MDWDPRHSSLFTGAGINWDPRQSTLGTAISNIDWDPSHSEAFREVIFPTLEIVAIAGATIVTGGAALPAIGVTGTAAIAGGMAAGAAVASGASLAEKQMGYETHTFYADVAPYLGSLLGSGYLASNPPVANPDPVTVPPEIQGIVDEARNVRDAAQPYIDAAQPYIDAVQQAQAAASAASKPNPYTNPPAPALPLAGSAAVSQAVTSSKAPLLLGLAVVGLALSMKKR